MPRSIMIASAMALFLAAPLAHGRTLTPGVSGEVSFPVPSGIKENVDFWRDVFSRYKISDVVFHDEFKLGRIYGVLDLGGPWMSSRSQKRLMRRRERKIKSVLSALAYGRTPPSSEGRLAARLRKIFSGQPRSELRLAISRVRSQPGLKERFRDSYIRSGRYLPHFRRIFQKYGLPKDLTLLPHVESGFREAIYSHAGASGMWQFTRATGRLFMRVDRTIDGRRDPFISADAAARLFKRNYEDLKSWPLAITAYNHGAVGMRRAVRQVGSRDIGAIVKRYKGRTFGFASRNFYASFVAAMHVHKYAKKYFGNLRPEPPARFSVFHLPGYVRLEKLSRRIGIESKVLRKMNPALRSSVLRGRRSIPRGYPLRVPPNEIARVRQSYNRNSSNTVASKTDENTKWVWVRSGDSLGKISRRFRVSLNDLKDENNLVGNKIIVGDRLRIPNKGGLQKSKKRTLRIASKSSKKNKRKSSKFVRVSRLAKSVNPKDKIGDTAIKFQDSHLSGPNSPIKNILFVGPSVAQKEESKPWTLENMDSVSDFPERGSQIRREALVQALAVVSSSKKRKVGWVRVQENETIGHFSEWLKISSRVIRRMNRIRSSRRVRIGKRIRIPFYRVSKKKFMDKRISFHENVEKEFLNKYSVLKTSRHRVKAGENVWTLIVRTYKIPFWLFRQYNADRDLRRVSVGEELVIPVLEPRSF